MARSIVRPGILALTIAMLPTSVTWRLMHATPAPDAVAVDAARIERGAYLVRTMGCNDCHTPHVPTAKGVAPDMSRALTGHPADVVMTAPPALPAGPWGWIGAATNTAFAGPWGVSFAANLTPDPETGLGKWTEEMFIATVKTARHQGKGRPLLPPMPVHMLAALTDSDLRDLFAYLQSLPPVRNRVPSPIDQPEADTAKDSGGLPETLADTGLFEDLQSGVVRAENRAFAPQYSLWSDGLTKKRWVYLPPGATIDATDVDRWVFPVGIRFWKEFSLNGRRVETRLLWKRSPTDWAFGSYVWNDAGTDARLAPAEGVKAVVELSSGRSHSIPSNADCTACHGKNETGPLGFNALQLSTDRDPNAIHGEPFDPATLTLKDLVSEHRLLPQRHDLVANPPRIKTENPSTRAILGYLAANCAMCHNGRDEIAADGPSMTYRELLEDGDAVARAYLARRSVWQIPGIADEETMLVQPGRPDESALLVRMRSRSPSSQMPPLGTVMKDKEAVDAVARWIAVDLMRLHLSTAAR